MRSACCLLLALLALPASAGVERFEVRSFGRRQVPLVGGGWYPLFIQFEYSGPAGAGRVEAVNPHQGSSWIVPVELSSQTRRRVTLYCYQRNPPGAEDRLLVRLWRGEQKLAEQPLELLPLAAERPRILLLGHPDLLRFADPRQLSDGAAVVHHPADGQLPDRAEGYDPFGLVIACRYPLGELDPAQQRALRRFIEAGGELLYSADSARAGEPPGSFLAGLLPVRDTAPAPGTTLAAVERWLRLPAGEAAPFRAVAGRAGDGAVLLDDGGARIAERELGLGRVVFCGYDISRPPLVDWGKRHRLLQRMTRRPAAFEPTAVMRGPVRALLDRAPSSAFLGWVALYLLCYVMALAGGGVLLARRLQRSPRVVLVLPAIVGLFSLAAPLLQRTLLHTRSHWQSLTLRYQRAGAATAVEWSYFMAYTPGAQRTAVRFEEPELACHPPLVPDSADRWGERSVQGPHPYLDRVDLFLTGRNYLLARRLRPAAPIAGRLVVEPERFGVNSVRGEVDGVAGGRPAVLLLGERAGEVVWERRAAGIAKLRATLDSTPGKAVWRLLRDAGLRFDRSAGTVQPWSPALPAAMRFGACLVYLEEAGEPARPRAGWRSHRHLRLWTLQLPLELPAAPGGRGLALPAGLVRGATTHAVRAGTKEPPRYTELEKTFELPPQAREARRLVLRFEVRTTERFPASQVTFALYDPRRARWERRTSHGRVAGGRSYLGPRGEVRARLLLEGGRPKQGFEIQRFELAVELEQ